MTYTVCDLPCMLSVTAAGMDKRSIGGMEPKDSRGCGLSTNESAFDAILVKP